MREIKFRAWDTTRKEYLSGGSVILSILPGKNPKETSIYLDLLQNPNRYKDRFIIEQFTGLLDSKGRECYEGDIAADETWGRIKILWYQPEAKFVFEDEHGNMEDFNATVALATEIVSTIHESE